MPRDLVIIGLRDFEEEEAAIIEEHDIKVIPVKEVRERGGKAIVKEVLEYLADCAKIHVSFDVDSLDPSISVGTGTPVPDGLFLDEGRDLLTGLCSDPKTATLDVVEINPALDTRNAMAENVLTILEPLFHILRAR
jgi:arginase